jgi:hypothetical protein
MEAIEIIKKMVEQKTGYSISEKTRQRNIVEARSLFFVAVRKLLPNISYSAMGRAVNVNHATVLHALTMYEIYKEYTPSLKNDLALIEHHYKKDFEVYNLTNIDSEIERLELRLNQLRNIKTQLEEKKANAYFDISN